MALPVLETPTFELTLPSTGSKIKFRPFLVKEHKILLTMADAENDEVARIIRELVNVCTFEKINVAKIPYIDVEYIFMNLRAKSIGEMVDVVINCECGTKIDAKFNIDDLKIEKGDGHTNKILITDDLGIEMQYPTIDEVLGIFASDDNDKVIDMIISNVKGIYRGDEYWEARDQTKQEMETFLYSLTKSQFDKLEQFFVTAPKIVQVIESDCPDCKKHNVSRLEGLQNFFV
jgi:hypothetical protein